MSDERQQRIDGSIAKQLQRSMERNATLSIRIERLEAALREIKDQYLTPDQSSAIAKAALAPEQE